MSDHGSFRYRPSRRNSRLGLRVEAKRDDQSSRYVFEAQ